MPKIGDQPIRDTAVSPTPNVFYFGKVIGVEPSMNPDGIHIYFTNTGGQNINFEVTPSSSSNAQIQTQIVNCLIAAQTNNQNLHIHTDGTSRIDWARLGNAV
jgi:hypothetical protein